MTKLFFLFLALFILPLCIIQCDLDDTETCGDAFTESEVNDTIATANAYGIIMKNGCTTVISGSINTGLDDYFVFNTGNAGQITITVTWVTGSNDVDLYLQKYDATFLASSATLSTTSESIQFTVFDPSSLRYIYINGSGGAANYTLTITGTRAIQ